MRSQIQIPLNTHYGNLGKRRIQWIDFKNPCKAWPVRPEAERENEVLRVILEMILRYQLRHLLQKVFLSSYPMALFLTRKQDLGKFK